MTMENEETKRPKKKLTIVLLIVVGIMVAQNFFMVLKIDEKNEKIEGLNEAVRRLTQIQTGDTLHTIGALNMDSTMVLIGPQGSRSSLFLIFTTWCQACEANMEQWNHLVDDVDGMDLQIVGITSDSLYKVKAYQARMDMRFPVYSVAHDFSIMKRYKLLSYPNTLLVDSAGVVRNVWNGVFDSLKRKEVAMQATR